ncbi:hypothetical protein [Geodermatophilus sp. SYSU D01105]
MADPPLQVDSAVIAAALDRLRDASPAPGQQLSEALTELEVAYEDCGSPRRSCAHSRRRSRSCWPPTDGAENTSSPRRCRWRCCRPTRPG